MSRRSRQLRILFTSAAATVLGGCAKHIQHAEPPPILNRSYVDLEVGWRIMTVTPILRSGKYKPEIKETSSANGGAELSAGDDFIGYEISYYEVTPGKQYGVAIEFVAAENKINGKASRQAQPRARLFDLSSDVGFIRLVFLTRASRADHNQAILAAADLEELNRLTEALETDTAAICESQRESHCEWIPEGISVQPEKRDPQRPKKWVPAT